MQERWSTIQKIWQSTPALYVIAGFIAGMLFFPTIETLYEDSGELLADFIPEAVGIAFTVLLIDRLYQQRDRRNQRERLIRDMASTANEIAKRAVEELKVEGWLVDGSLRGHNFRNANLEAARIGFDRDYLQDEKPIHADLQNVNMRRASLQMAKLHHVSLRYANLSVANLQYANLFDADLSFADLFEANLHGADLRNAELEGAIFDRSNLENVRFEDKYGKAHFSKDTILPDGTNWTPDTNMRRFTDPEYPDFWQPDWVKQQGSDAD